MRLTENPENLENDMVDVHSPIGIETVYQTGIAPNLATLNGKTIAESWNGDFKGDVTFPIIRALLQQQFPYLRIVPYTEFPYRHGADDPAAQKALAKDIALRAQALGCDAVISGNGA